MFSNNTYLVPNFGPMRVVEVTNKKLARAFLEVPLRIYKDDQNWVRPLDKDIEAVFDKKENKFFRHGKAIRWILENDKGAYIGRVAAFVNNNLAYTYNQPTGGMGFFECVDDKEAAFKLFDTCKEWLEKQGMEAMDGPINFGERDRWWGLLIDGFTPPTYCMNYNPPYYRKFFEEYGFHIYFEQYTYARKVGDPIPELYHEKAERISRDPNYHFAHIDKRQLKKHAQEFVEVYNDAWGSHPGFKPMAQAQAFTLLKSIKPIIDEEIIVFGYYKNEPVAFFLMLPELNQIFRHLNGKLDWLGKLKFLYYKWRGEARKMFGMVFGVKQAHQKKGVEAALVDAAAQIIQPKNRYDEMEMIWIGDFNPVMIKIAESTGGKRVKTYYTYRKLFDAAKEFKRAPILGLARQKEREQKEA